MIRFLLLVILKVYQIYFSPVLGHSCRFIPTCSRYMYEAIELYGARKGVCLGARRLARCHPFHPGGYDPVVEPSKHPSLNNGE
jgi:putative membrane protein insertion efficiency factor